MEKTYVLDTSVLLQTPSALEVFEDNQVVLPLVVLEELDGLKGADGEQGANARQAIRRLEELRMQGDLLTGVPLPGGGRLRVETNCVDISLPNGLPGSPNHRRILQVCQAIRQAQGQVTLVTKNILLRIKAQMLGLAAEDFTSEQVPVSQEQYTGRCAVFVAEKHFEHFPKRALPRQMCIRWTRTAVCSRWTWCATNSFSFGPTSPTARRSWAALTERKSSPCLTERKSPMAFPPGTSANTFCKRP